VNLTTGQKENFGVVTDAQFIDSKFGANNSILPLRQGDRYRYEVGTLLRAPETLFDNFSKTIIDPASKKSYTFYPAKFFHPIALTKGNILERPAQEAHYPKDDLSFGDTGDLVTVEVSFGDEQVKLTDAKAVKYDKNHILLQWTLNGSSKLVENFIVILEENGMQVPIGKVHATDEKKQYEYIHTISRSDVGSYIYNIIPLLSDYSMGPSVKSNAVLVV
jgi:hypothetical protein